MCLSPWVWITHRLLFPCFMLHVQRLGNMLRKTLWIKLNIQILATAQTEVLADVDIFKNPNTFNFWAAEYEYMKNRNTLFFQDRRLKSASGWIRIVTKGLKPRFEWIQIYMILVQRTWRPDLWKVTSFPYRVMFIHAIWSLKDLWEYCPHPTRHRKLQKLFFLLKPCLSVRSTSPNPLPFPPSRVDLTRQWMARNPRNLAWLMCVKEKKNMSAPSGLVIRDIHSQKILLCQTSITFSVYCSMKPHI